MTKKLISLFFIFSILFTLVFLRLGTLITDPFLIEKGKAQGLYTIPLYSSRGQIYDSKLFPFTNNNTKNINIAQLSPKPYITANNADISFAIPKRYDKQLAPHILGYLDQSGNGITGIERAFNDFLSANSQNTTISYRLNGANKWLQGIKPTISYAQDRNDGVVLTIDHELQAITEVIGNRYIKKGAVVIIDPYSGKLRAVASFPSYDQKNLKSAIIDKNSPLINRAFMSYDVGSTFKLVTLAQALLEGISEDYTYYCNGSITVNGVTINCHNKNGHGKLNMKEALKVSCNPYYINLGQMLSRDKMLNLARDFSFSKASYFKTIVSSGGKLPTIEELQNDGDMANFSFGQGNLLATPVQIAQLVSSIVNNGKTPNAQLIEGITLNGDTIQSEPQMPQIQAIPQSIAQVIKGYLIACVMENQNQKATPNFTTAGGKTGTAQTGQLNEFGKEKLQGWFAGFYPQDKPKYVIVVLNENATSGNASASPVFREIVDHLESPKLAYIN